MLTLSKSFSKPLKAISLTLALSFLGEQLLWANPEIKPFSFPKDDKVELSFQFPQSVATIEDSYQSQGHKVTRSPVTGHQKTIYLFQDAHTNESGQRNLAKALDTLLTHEKDIRYVFTEAGVEDNSLTFLREKAPLHARKRASDIFLKKGLLHGAELLQLTSDHDFTLWGVEDMELYIKALENYRDVASVRPKLKDYLAKIRSTLTTLQPKVLNPLLDKFLQDYENYHREKSSLTDYFGSLMRRAESQGLSLSDYTHLALLRELTLKESQIDFAKANQEQAQAVQSLSKEDQSELNDLLKNKPGRVGANGHAQKAFYALLEEKVTRSQGHKVTAFPQLEKYFTYLKLSRHLEAKQVLEELAKLEAEVFAKLAVTEDEQAFIRSARLLSLYEKLFQLTLTTDEYAEYQKLSHGFSIRELTGFLNKQIMQLSSYYERALFLESSYDEAVQKSEEFYDLTLKRDEAFVEKMLKKLDSSPLSTIHDPRSDVRKAVLIAGGYHAANLKHILKSKNISYVSITPQILQETNQKKYEAILLGQRITQKSQTPPALSAPSSGRFLMAMALYLTPYLADYQNIAQVKQGTPYVATPQPAESVPSGARLAKRRQPSWKPQTQKVAVIGTGYVGLTKAVTLATDWGHDVVGVDIVAEKAASLARGEMPKEMYVPGMDNLLKEAVATNKPNWVVFTTDYAQAVNGRDIIFLALPTPQSDSGEADLRYMAAAITSIAKLVKPGEEKILVGKSTVPPVHLVDGKVVDTLKWFQEIAAKHLAPGAKIHIAWEPEYLRQGSELFDDRGGVDENGVASEKDRGVGRVVIGADDPAIRRKIRTLYQNPNPKHPRRDLPFVEMSTSSAMLVKYGANGWRGTKISFINFLSWFTRVWGYDITRVADFLGEDSRILRAFLYAGIGFGGSCFPKDFAALVFMADILGVPSGLLRDVQAVNDAQWRLFYLDILRTLNKSVVNKTVVLLGASFKPGTADIREALSIKLASKLLEEGAIVRVYDPNSKAAANMALHSDVKPMASDTGGHSNPTYYTPPADLIDVVKGASAIVLVTEWPEFRQIDFAKLKEMAFDNDPSKLPVILDGRNILDGSTIKSLGYPQYVSIGRGFVGKTQINDERFYANFLNNSLWLALATRISFVTILTQIAHEVEGANIRDVLKGLGLDPVVGDQYLVPGLGIGGEHLPESLIFSRLHVEEHLNGGTGILGLYSEAQIGDPDDGHISYVGQAIEQEKKLSTGEASSERRIPFASAISFLDDFQIKNHLRQIRIAAGVDPDAGRLDDKTVAVLGLSYRAALLGEPVSSVRNSPSIRLIRELLRLGAKVQASDENRQAVRSARNKLKRSTGVERLDFIGTSGGEPYMAIAGSDVQVIALGSESFKDWQRLFFDEDGKPRTASLNIVDIPHLYDKPEAMIEKGIRYFSLGYKSGARLSGLKDWFVQRQHEQVISKLNHIFGSNEYKRIIEFLGLRVGDLPAFTSFRRDKIEKYSPVPQYDDQSEHDRLTYRDELKLANGDTIVFFSKHIYQNPIKKAFYQERTVDAFALLQKEINFYQTLSPHQLSPEAKLTGVGSTASIILKPVTSIFSANNSEAYLEALGRGLAALHNLRIFHGGLTEEQSAKMARIHTGLKRVLLREHAHLIRTVGGKPSVIFYDFSRASREAPVALLSHEFNQVSDSLTDSEKKIFQDAYRAEFYVNVLASDEVSSNVLADIPTVLVVEQERVAYLRTELQKWILKNPDRNIQFIIASSFKAAEGILKAAKDMPVVKMAILPSGIPSFMSPDGRGFIVYGQAASAGLPVYSHNAIELLDRLNKMGIPTAMNTSNPNDLRQTVVTGPAYLIGREDDFIRHFDRWLDRWMNDVSPVSQPVKVAQSGARLAGRNKGTSGYWVTFGLGLTLTLLSNMFYNERVISSAPAVLPRRSLDTLDDSVVFFWTALTILVSLVFARPAGPRTLTFVSTTMMAGLLFFTASLSRRGQVFIPDVLQNNILWASPVAGLVAAGLAVGAVVIIDRIQEVLKGDRYGARLSESLKLGDIIDITNIAERQPADFKPGDLIGVKKVERTPTMKALTQGHVVSLSPKIKVALAQVEKVERGHIHYVLLNSRGELAYEMSLTIKLTSSHVGKWIDTLPFDPTNLAAKKDPKAKKLKISKGMQKVLSARNILSQSVLSVSATHPAYAAVSSLLSLPQDESATERYPKEIKNILKAHGRTLSYEVSIKLREALAALVSADTTDIARIWVGSIKDDELPVQDGIKWTANSRHTIYTELNLFLKEMGLKYPLRSAIMDIRDYFDPLAAGDKSGIDAKVAYLESIYSNLSTNGDAPQKNAAGYLGRAIQAIKDVRTASLKTGARLSGRFNVDFRFISGGEALLSADTRTLDQKINTGEIVFIRDPDGLDEVHDEISRVPSFGENPIHQGKIANITYKESQMGRGLLMFLNEHLPGILNSHYGSPISWRDISGPVDIVQPKLGSFENIYQIIVRMKSGKVALLAGHVARDTVSSAILESDIVQQQSLTRLNSFYLPRLYQGAELTVDEIPLMLYVGEWKTGYHEIRVDPTVNTQGFGLYLWEHGAGIKNDLALSVEQARDITRQIYMILTVYNTLRLDFVYVNAGDFVAKPTQDGGYDVSLITTRMPDGDEPKITYRTDRAEFRFKDTFYEYFAGLLSQSAQDNSSIHTSDKFQKIRFADYETVLSGVEDGLAEIGIKSGASREQAKLAARRDFILFLNRFTGRFSKISDKYVKENEAKIRQSINTYLTGARLAAAVTGARLPDGQAPDTMSPAHQRTEDRGQASENLSPVSSALAPGLSARLGDAVLKLAIHTAHAQPTKLVTGGTADLPIQIIADQAAIILELSVPEVGTLIVREGGEYEVRIRRSPSDQQEVTTLGRIINLKSNTNDFVLYDPTLVQSNKSLYALVFEALDEKKRLPESNMKIGFSTQDAQLLKNIRDRLEPLDKALEGQLLGPNGIFDLSGETPAGFEVVEARFPEPFEKVPGRRYIFMKEMAAGEEVLYFAVRYARTTRQLEISTDQALEWGYVQFVRYITGNNSPQPEVIKQIIEGDIQGHTIQEIKTLKAYSALPRIVGNQIGEALRKAGSRLAALLQAA